MAPFLLRALRAATPFAIHARGLASAAGGVNPRFAHLVPGAGTYPVGFKAAGVSAGIKKKAGAKDMALVATDPALPCVAAGVFTTNQFQAAAVTLDKEILATNGAAVYGVVTNSGCANAWCVEGCRD